MKIEILICTGLMLNDHSNPYMESTTVLSDICKEITYVFIIDSSRYIYYFSQPWGCYVCMCLCNYIEFL